MKITVIVCSFNGAEYIEEQLFSIVSQTRKPDEIIINDDMSIDGTKEILTKWKESSEIPIKLNFNKRRLGYVKNFEKALLDATGDVIVFSDQDDVWYLNKLAIIEQEFRQDHLLDLIFSNAQIVNDKLESKGYSLFTSVGLTERKINKINNGKAFQELLKYNVVTGATMAVRKRTVEVVTPFSINWVHDAWISIIISMVSKIKVIDQNLIMYRQHELNQVGTTNNIVEKISRVFRKGDLSEKGIKQMADLIKFIDNQPGLNLSSNINKTLEQKYRHYLSRSRFPKNKLKRIFFIFKELVTLNYIFYSNGYKSALKDLLIKK